MISPDVPSGQPPASAERSLAVRLRELRGSANVRRAGALRRKYRHGQLVAAPGCPDVVDFLLRVPVARAA